LKKLSPTAGTDPRIFLLEAEARAEVATLAETLEACRRAAYEAQARSARLTLAQARLCEGTTLARMGRDAEALQTLEGAKTLFAASADTIGMIRALEEIAKVNRHVGPTEARKYVSEAVALAREVGALPPAMRRRLFAPPASIWSSSTCFRARAGRRLSRSRRSSSIS
jgi:hypothetical protein